MLNGEGFSIDVYLVTTSRSVDHPTKSHVVVAKSGDTVKTIRFGQQGVKTNQHQRRAFHSRHARNISKGECGVLGE